jgi:hypothetical protein
MGFNKRFVDKEMIESFRNGKTTLDEIFKGDAIILLDDIANKVYTLYIQKTPIDLIKTKLSEYDGR